LLHGRHKLNISIWFSEEMVYLFDFIFVRRPFLGVRHLKNTEKWDIKILGLLAYIIMTAAVIAIGPTICN